MNHPVSKSPQTQQSINEPITNTEEFAQTQPLVDQQEQQQGLDLNDTDYLMDSVGVETSDLKGKTLKTIIEKRDQERWQLNPDSADNY